MSLNDEHRRKLRSSGLSDEQIDALGWTSLHNGRLLIPYLRPDGTPEQKRDGLPFTRERLSEAELKGKDGKYRSPAKNGCRIYHSHLSINTGRYQQHLADRFRPLRITEGELKVEAAAAHDPKRVTIGLGGVNSWKDRYDEGEESKPLVDWDEIPLQGREVRLCFDSDLEKPQVMGALKQLAEFLASRGARVLIELLPHDLNGERLGLDDLIHRHGAAAFERMVAIARPAFRTKVVRGEEVNAWVFAPEPVGAEESHQKASMAWAVFKDAYAARLGAGLYRWEGTHWGAMGGRPPEPLNGPLHQWMDRMGWKRRASSVFGSLRQELSARIERAGWDAPHMMAFENGTLDTRANAFTPGHRRDDCLTFAFPFAYDPAATCPRWRQFLEETIGEPDLITLLRAAFRWSLMPKDSTQPFRHELAFDVHGRRGTGKGTLLEALQAVCGGRRGVGVIKSAGFSNANALYGLIGKRVAVDPDASGRISDPGVFNNVVSNEPVEVKKLYADAGSERLGVVVWRFYNDQPGASGGGLEGMGRRVVTFRFDRQIEKPDRNLKATLIGEAAGIFAWAWSMGEEAMHEALTNVGRIKAIREAAIDAALEREPILRFLVEAFPDGSAGISGAELFKQWKEWAQAEGHEHGSSTRFGAQVKKVSAVHSTRAKGGRMYRIEPMGGFDLVGHLGISGPEPEEPEKVTGWVTGWPSNPSPDPSPSPQEPQTVGGSDAPRTTGDGLNPSPTPNPSPNPSPLNPLQSLGSEEVVTGMQGLSQKPRVENENRENKISSGCFHQKPVKPCTPVTSPPEGLLEPLLAIRQQHPHAVASQVALELQAAGHGQFPYARVKEWLGWVYQQQEAA